MKIAVAGNTGRVGTELTKLINNTEHQLTAVWNSSGPKMLNSNQTGWDKSNIDIVIDFSLSESFQSILLWCQDQKVPLVSGVTGLGELNDIKLIELLKSAELKIPFFWSSNMSVGIALLKKFIVDAKLLNPKTVEICETHHIHKKDSPSGTALSLARAIKEKMGYNKEVPIHAKREEEVFGIHKVIFKSDDEIVEIYHEAMNRVVFASGALKVAEWLVEQKRAQFYTMEEFIRDAK